MTTAYALEAKTGNMGNYVGYLTGKSQEQRLQDNRTRVSFVTLASSYGHFCRNSREPTLTLFRAGFFRPICNFKIAYTMATKFAQDSGRANSNHYRYCDDSVT